jgi:hypothetical protein
MIKDSKNLWREKISFETKKSLEKIVKIDYKSWEKLAFYFVI